MEHYDILFPQIKNVEYFILIKYHKGIKNVMDLITLD